MGLYEVIEDVFKRYKEGNNTNNNSILGQTTLSIKKKKIFKQAPEYDLQKIIIYCIEIV